MESDSPLSRIVAALDFQAPLSPEAMRRLKEMLLLLQSAPARAIHWVRMDAEEVAVRVQLAKRAFQRAKRLAELRQEAVVEWHQSWETWPWHAILARVKRSHHDPLQWLQRQYWEDRRILKQVMHTSRGSPRQRLEVLERIAERAELERWFRLHAPTFDERFESDYDGAATDWAELCAALEWAEAFQLLLEAKPVPRFVLTYLRQPNAWTDDLRNSLSELRRQLGE